MESVPVDGAVPVHRDTKDVLRFLALPGMWIYPAGHPEDLVSLLSVTRHLGNLPSPENSRRAGARRPTRPYKSSCTREAAGWGGGVGGGRGGRGEGGGGGGGGARGGGGRAAVRRGPGSRPGTAPCPACGSRTRCWRA